MARGPRKKAKKGEKPPRDDLREAFVEEYVIDFNATAAARRAGYASRTAAIQGSRLLNDISVRVSIDALLAKTRAKIRATPERLALEAERIALSDIRDYVSFDANGVVLKSSTTIADEKAGAIADVGSSPGQFGVAMRLKLHSKIAALDWLAKVNRLYVAEMDKNTIAVTPFGKRKKDDAT